MDKLYFFAAGSFLTSAFGYVIFYFWIRPIAKYRSVKRKIIQATTAYLNSVYKLSEDVLSKDGIDEIIEEIRRNSLALTDCYDMTLPEWYRLLLQSRGESPIGAAKHLLGLSNTRNYENAKNRVEKIRQALNIS